MLFHNDGRPVRPGQDHARDVCEHLNRVAHRVRYLDLAKVWPQCPEKGDISDWIAAGHTREELDVLIQRGTDPPQVPNRFQLYPFNAIRLSTKPSYLVKGILPRVGLAVIWGPPKCGKSFWTFDIAMHIALGWDYRGHRVQQGTIVYLALEGGHGFRKRIEAWRQHYLSDHRETVPFYLADVAVDLIADHPALIAAIKAQLGEQVPVTVVIDTLNRGLHGDENKSDDMAKFIRAADAVRNAFECLVAIVHHCGVQGGRPRGHTSLAGADDGQVAVEKDENNIITASVEHMKDDEAGAVIVSRLERVELGLDDDGDQITSCVVVPSEAAIKAPKLPPAAKRALQQLQELIADVGIPAPASNHIPTKTRVVLTDTWRAAFYKAHVGEKPDTKQKAFVRAVERLQDAHLVGVWGEFAWLAGQAGHGRTNGKMSGLR